MRRAKRPKPRHVKHKGTSARKSRLVTAVIVVLGVLIMSYPSIASWVDQVNQTRLIGNYKETVDTFDEGNRYQELKDAHTYNAELKDGVAYDPYAEAAVAPDTEQFDRYMSLLEGIPSGVMARLRAPSIDVDLPIYHGTSDATLRKGVGHLYGTALPVGGKGLHPVLTAHSGLADAVMFTNLDQLEPGDIFQVETYGEKVTYEVVQKDVIYPDETDVLKPDPDRDLMSLVTCTPVTVNTHRLVVTGERIPNPIEPSELLPDRDLPGFPWWMVWTGATLVGATIYTFGGRKEDKKAKTPKPSTPEASEQ